MNFGFRSSLLLLLLLYYFYGEQQTSRQDCRGYCEACRHP
jgi:hypothetical protein